MRRRIRAVPVHIKYKRWLRYFTDSRSSPDPQSLYLIVNATVIGDATYYIYLRDHFSIAPTHIELRVQ